MFFSWSVGVLVSQRVSPLSLSRGPRLKPPTLLYLLPKNPWKQRFDLRATHPLDLLPGAMSRDISPLKYPAGFCLLRALGISNYLFLSKAINSTRKGTVATTSCRSIWPGNRLQEGSKSSRAATHGYQINTAPFPMVGKTGTHHGLQGEGNTKARKGASNGGSET